MSATAKASVAATMFTDTVVAIPAIPTVPYLRASSLLILPEGFLEEELTHILRHGIRWIKGENHFFYELCMVRAIINHHIGFSQGSS